jgi:U3 small nucleolar RNA-associated protein 14
LLKTARLREEDMKETEDLKMNHLTPEEVLARRTELRKMRDLMFRAEAKAKRVAKIKSKTYRRIRKKERTKLAEKLGDMDEEDPDGEEANMRRELERAKERATLRHKNTGKWAKSMKGRGELDDEQRRDVSEMLDRGEKLRRRIQGVGSDDDESGEDDIDSDADDEVLKASAFDELTALRAQAEVDSVADSSAKSVFQMKFMKDAARRDMQKVNESIDDYARELEGGVLEDDEEPNPMTEASATVHRLNGRVSYQPGQLVSIVLSSIFAMSHALAQMTGASLRPLGSMESTSSSATLKSTDFLPDSPDGDRAKRTPLRVTPPPESYSAAKPAENPWLLPRIEGGPSKGKKNEVLVGKGSLAPDKSKHKLQKQSLKQDDERAKARADAELEISLDTVLTRPIATAVPESGKTKQKRSKANTSAAPEAGDSDDHNSEAEGQEQLLQRKGKKTGAFQQRDLVAQAFAGDNVVQVSDMTV